MQKPKIRDWALALGLVCGAGAANADFDFTLAPSPITAPAVLTFSNATFPGNLATGSTGTGFNFTDTWFFTLSTSATVSGLAAAFRFDSSSAPTFGIGNLQVNLLDVTNSFTVVSGWQTVTPGDPFTHTLSVTPAAGLVAGNTYALQVRGLLLAPPAAYTGSLIAAATPTVVPLPAALPLLVAGLGLMGLFARRKKGQSLAA